MVLMGSTYAYSFNGVFNSKDIKVKTSADHSPLKVGENTVTVELIDANGANIKDAQVSVYFFMPSMPAMNYEVKTSLNGEKYAAVIKPTMPGQWAADIKVMKSGGEESKVQVDFEAR
jgi:nitrogen fixation protein FixH